MCSWPSRPIPSPTPTASVQPSICRRHETLAPGAGRHRQPPPRSQRSRPRTATAPLLVDRAREARACSLVPTALRRRRRRSLQAVGMLSGRSRQREARAQTHPAATTATNPAVVPLRHQGGWSQREFMRRLSDIVYRAMLNDYVATKATGPGGHQGASLQSSAAGSHPHTSTSEKPLPGPVTTKPTTSLPKAS